MEGRVVGSLYPYSSKRGRRNYRVPLHLLIGFALLCVGTSLLHSCQKDTPPIGSLGLVRDSAAVMITNGVSKLISDSGVMRYRVIAERWEVFDHTTPPRQYFPKGLFLQRFDNSYKMDLYIEADSAWCYNSNLWKLKGRVFINDLSLRRTFRTEELFWDMQRHCFYSNVYIQITEPDREIAGDRFWSNEKMTNYRLERSHGYMPMPENSSATPSDNGAETAQPDNNPQPARSGPQAMPKRR